jgi:hypothetical protein
MPCQLFFMKGHYFLPTVLPALFFQIKTGEGWDRTARLPGLGNLTTTGALTYDHKYAIKLSRIEYLN